MNAHRLAAPPATHRPRFGRSLLALCAFFALLCPSLVWSASCSYTNFSIGFEYSAQVGPDAQGRYLFAASPLRCDGSGNVIFDPGMN